MGFCEGPQSWIYSTLTKGKSSILFLLLKDEQEDA